MYWDKADKKQDAKQKMKQNICYKISKQSI